MLTPVTITSSIKKIKGLITKYGGVNSHMAIRCAELSVPAAIGSRRGNL